jgi:hypothetical protein
MDEITIKKNFSIKTWLFNPFHYLAGGSSLVTGLVVIIAASLAASFSNSHFDGVLDFHTAMRVPVWLFVSEGLISWLCMAGVLSLAGLIISKSRFRVIDVFGTQALARSPSLITGLAALLPGFAGFANQVAKAPANFSAFAQADPRGLVSFIILMVIVTVMIVWMVYLMYRAFAVSCNVSGAKAILMFTAAVILAEVLSKILLGYTFIAVLGGK